jgi:hypothetical protein
MAGREEQKRRQAHTDAAIASVKQALAWKVLTAARDTALSYDGLSGERTGANSVRFAIQRALAECGVDLDAIKKKGEDAELND